MKSHENQRGKVDIDIYYEQALSEGKSELCYTFKIEVGRIHVLTFCCSIAAYSTGHVMQRQIREGRLINQLQLVAREEIARCKVFRVFNEASNHETRH